MTEPDPSASTPVSQPASDRLLDHGPVSLPAVKRLLDADWKAVGSAVLPVLLALVVGAQLAALTPWLSGDSSAGSNGVGAYLSAIAMLSCAAFLGGITASSETNSDGFNPTFTAHVVPLGITVLVLITAWFAIKRSARGDRRERTEFAIRVSVVTGLVVLALALASRIDAGLGDGQGSVHANAIESLFGALVLMLAVTVLAARDGEPWLASRLGSWAAPARGAVSGLITACLLGFLAGLVAVIATVVANDGSVLDVLRGLPLAVAFLPTIGLAVAHVALLGTIDLSAAAFFGGGGGVGLLDRHGASGWYWLVVLIAPVIIGVAIIRALRAAAEADEAGELDEVTARRVALRVAVPLAAGWALLSLVARLRVGAFGFGSSVGPTLWQTFVLPAAWVLVLGFLLSSRLRGFARPRPAGRSHAPVRLSTLCLGFVVASVLLAAGAAAGAQQDRSGSVFGLTGEDTSSTFSAGESVGAVRTAPVPSEFIDVQSLAEDLASAEDSYHADHAEYTTDLSELSGYGFIGPSDLQWNGSGVNGEACIVLTRDGDSWTWDSTKDSVEQGDHC